MGDVRGALMPIFLEEATENLAAIEAYLRLAGQGSQEEKPLLEAAFRSAHSVKGTAALVRLLTISTIANLLEDTLEELFQRRAAPSPALVRAMRFALGKLKEMVILAAGGGQEPSGVLEEVDQAFAAVRTEPLPPSEVPPPFQIPTAESPSQPSEEERVLSPSREENFPPPEVKQPPSLMPTPGPLGEDDLPSAAQRLVEELLLAKPEPRAPFLCCRFRIAGREYHLPIEQMAEISELPPFTPVPLAPPFVSGLINLRGNVMPVIDLGRLNDSVCTEEGPLRMVVAQSAGEQLAFVAEGMPNLSTECAGERLDLTEFLDLYRVRPD